MPVGGVDSILSPANADLPPGSGMSGNSLGVQMAAGMSGGRRRGRRSRRGRSRRGGMRYGGARRRTRRMRKSRKSRR
jgi:hypothetical protein